MSDKLPPLILVMDSDPQKCNAICSIIERYWFNVLRCTKNINIERLLLVNNPHVIIICSDLDINRIAKYIRSVKNFSNIPMIYVLNEMETDYKFSVKDELTEVVHRPITNNNLMPLIKMLLRKSKPVFRNKIIKFHDITIDIAAYQTYRNNKRLKVGPTEFKILELLIQSPEIVFSRQQIIDYVWGTDNDIDIRTVDVHVNRLRNSLKISNTDTVLIKTIRSAGYSLSLPGEIY